MDAPARTIEFSISAPSIRTSAAYGRERSDVGGMDPRAGADHGGPAHGAGFEARGGMDGDRALDLAVPHLGLDRLAPQALEREAITGQDGVRGVAEAPPCLGATHVNAAANPAQVIGESVELAAGPSFESVRGGEDTRTHDRDAGGRRGVEPYRPSRRLRISTTGASPRYRSHG